MFRISCKMNLISFFFKLLLLCSFLHAQINYLSNIFSLPRNALISEFSSFIKDSKSQKNIFGYNISYHNHLLVNSGHANLDNNAEIYSPGVSSRLISARFIYTNPWLLIEVEPYNMYYSKAFNSEPVNGTFQMNNNHTTDNHNRKTDIGFRQSRFILHYKGVGIGYGRMSHWWGPGFHSSLALSSNAPSQKTYALGTFQDILIGKFAFGFQIIAMPYISSSDVQLYFSGLKSHLTYYSNPIITIGFHRTYLSGDFGNLYTNTNSTDTWTLQDAVRLVVEPLFGQSKRNLDYAMPGTPGFDTWDQVLTGYFKLTFPDENLVVYADVASDDNRGNITDLKTHWDHTLGYQLGFKKFTKIQKINLFMGTEFLTTRTSNTFKPSFYRGDPNTINYYAKEPYDYFTYQGRRMGAHSGSSSDDLIFILGFGYENSMMFVSWNKERHGIKSKIYPELKTELVLTYHHTISNHQSAFITLEYESIRNYGFIQDRISNSKLLWLGYSVSLR